MPGSPTQVVNAFFLSKLHWLIKRCIPTHPWHSSCQIPGESTYLLSGLDLLNNLSWHSWLGHCGAWTGLGNCVTGPQGAFCKEAEEKRVYSTRPDLRRRTILWPSERNFKRKANLTKWTWASYSLWASAPYYGDNINSRLRYRGCCNKIIYIYI